MRPLTDEQIQDRLLSLLADHGAMTRSELLWKAGFMRGQALAPARAILKSLEKSGAVRCRPEIEMRTGRVHGKAFQYEAETMRYHVVRRQP